MWRGWTSNDIDLNIACGNYSRQNDNDNDNQKKITRWTELEITVTMAKVIHWPLAIIDQVTLLTLCDWVREWQWTTLIRASALLCKYKMQSCRPCLVTHQGALLIAIWALVWWSQGVFNHLVWSTCWCYYVHMNTLRLHILEHMNKEGP